MEDTNRLNLNKEVTRKIYNAFDTGNTADLANLIAAEAVDHNPDPGVTGKGPEMVKTSIQDYRKGFPDLKIKVNSMVAEGDRVIAHITMSGTHKGDFMGISATNKTVKVEGFDNLKIVDGKLAERWGVYDMLSMLNQIGIIADPATLIESARTEEKVY